MSELSQEQLLNQFKENYSEAKNRMKRMQKKRFTTSGIMLLVCFVVYIGALLFSSAKKDTPVQLAIAVVMLVFAALLFRKNIASVNKMPSYTPADIKIYSTTCEGKEIAKNSPIGSAFFSHPSLGDGLKAFCAASHLAQLYTGSPMVIVSGVSNGETLYEAFPVSIFEGLTLFDE